MGFFSEWMDNPKRPDPNKLGRDAVAGIDRYDMQDLKRIAKELRDFRIARDQLCDKAETGTKLAGDTFFGFLKVDPQLVPEGEIRPTYQINRKIQEQLWKTNEWNRLRTWTEGDIVNSAMAFVTVEEDIEALLDKAKKEQAAAEKLEQEQQELLAALQGKRTLDQMIEAWSEQLTEEELEAIQQVQADAAAALEQVAKDLAAAGVKLDKQMDNAVGAGMAALRKDMRDAADEAEAMSSAAMSWGMEPGQLQRMSATERLALAKRLNSNDRFQRLTALIGPMKRFAEAQQKRKVYHSFEEVYDVGLGNDLGRILPSEMVGILHPLRKLDFYRRFSERKLLQYEMRGEEKIAKGGIILAKDGSGSMNGDPDVWATAVGLAVMSIAREQKRSFYGINFGSPGYAGRPAEIETFDFRKNEDMTLDRIITYAEHFFAGGTDFMTPLTVALKVLQDEERQKGFVEGDILFVTDGICQVTPKWLAGFKAEQERLGFKVWGIMIGGDRQSDPLWTICDHNVVTITDLLSGDQVGEMFRDL